MDPKKLLATARTEFLLAVSEATQKTVPRCLEDLFKKADASYSSAEQGRLLNARSILQEQANSLKQQMSKTMEGLLTRSFQTTYNTYRPSVAYSLDATSLSLVDATAFEDELRIDDVTKRFRSEAEEQLRDLNIRIALLFEQDVIKERENPFRPYLLARCISTTVENFGLSADISTCLIEQFTENFAAHIAPIYNAVNSHLAKHGIAAQLQLKIKKSPTQSAALPLAAEDGHETDELEQVFRNSQQHGFEHSRPGFGSDYQNQHHAQQHSQYQNTNQSDYPTDGSKNRVDQLLDNVRGATSGLTQADTMLQEPGTAPQSKAGKPSGWLTGGQTMGGVLRKFFGSDRNSSEVSSVSDQNSDGTYSQVGAGGHEASRKAHYSDGPGNSSFFSENSRNEANDGFSAGAVGNEGGFSSGGGQLASTVYGMQRAHTPVTAEMYDSQGDVRNLILEQRAALNEMTKNVDELMTIDIVAMLFEFILRDNQVPAEVRAQLGRLQFMVLKIALRDTSLLTQKGHPARMLVNRIGSISLGLKQLDPSGVQITEEICRIVETLLHDESENPQLFSKMLDEFDAFIARELRAGDKNIERTVEAVEEVQNRTLRFAHTTAQMSEALSGLTIDAYLQEFLQSVWVLAVEMADRQDEKRARRYRLLVPDLLWSIVPKLKDDDRTQLFALLPIILNTLREGLASISWDAARQKDLMNWLVDAHTSALRASHSATLVHIPSLPSIHEHFEIFVNTPEASPNAEFSSKIVLDSRKFLEDAIKELDIKVQMLDQVFDQELPDERADETLPTEPNLDGSESIEERLRSGVAMEINLGGKPSTGQLKWVDPSVSNLVLSLDGQDQPSVVSVRMFRRMIAHGRVRFIESEPLFERAVQSLLKSADNVDQTVLA
ncbi:DUF1631 family protein [Undibacterium sp. Ren11W]|uniref:DUF1631 family protein n=1 Tax=Undibacterium sp. Ren11W TaxID=3413045 RepID=UPI003BF28207